MSQNFTKKTFPRFPSQVCFASLLILSLAACDAKILAEMQKSPEQKRAEALGMTLRTPKNVSYKEVVQVDGEILSYGGRYECSETIVEEKGKKPRKLVQVHEPVRTIQVEHGYFRSLTERPCYFKNGKTSLASKTFKAKKSGERYVGTPLVICPNAEALRTNHYDDKDSKCRRASGTLVSFDAWE